MNILLVVCSVVITLSLGELLLRKFAPLYFADSPANFRYDQELGGCLKEGVHLFSTTDYQREIKVNKIGTVNFQETFKGYSSLVFALGDSFTQGTGLPSEMSYPFQTDLILNTDYDGFYRKHYAVVNLGVAGYGGEQSLIMLKRYSKKIGIPSVVLYFGSENDYEDDQVFMSGYRHWFFVKGSPHWGSAAELLQWVTTDFQLGLRTKLAIDKILRYKISGKEPDKDAGKVNVPQISIAQREEKVLNELLQFCKDNHAVLILGWANPTPSYTWLKQWAAKNEIAFADWHPRVKFLMEAMPELPLNNNHSGGHYRGWVNRVIAEEFGKEVRQSVLHR